MMSLTLASISPHDVVESPNSSIIRYLVPLATVPGLKVKGLTILLTDVRVFAGIVSESILKRDKNDF